MSQTSSQKQSTDKQPLDTLQSMINGVLIETGNALRSANRKGAKTIGHTHNRLQAFLPNAIDKFHLALDELESDIVRARAVLSRDLRELQARHRLIENPSLQPAENATAVEDRDDQMEIVPLHESELDQSEPYIQLDLNIKDEDTTINGPDTSSITSPKPKLEEVLPPPSPKQISRSEVRPHESLVLSLQESKTSNTHVEEDASKAGSDSINLEIAQGLGIAASNPALSANLEAPAVGGLEETSFESMFDTSNNANSNLNFDEYDFAGDNSNDQAHDFETNTGDFDLAGFGSQIGNDNSDPSSVLHELEGFGTGGGNAEFSMLDLSGHSNNNESADQITGDEFGMSGGDLDMALGMGPNQSTFDDLLDGMDFGDGAENGGDSTMDHGQFDEAFFGINSDT